MKTLIFNGSPRINGDTDSLLKIIRENIVGDYKVVNAYQCNISPCIDCRFCWKEKGCAIQDEKAVAGLQEILQFFAVK